MLRDNLVGLIEPMPTARENDGSSLALSIHKQRQASDDRSSCLKNPRPAGAESSLTERTTSPFQTEPRQYWPLRRLVSTTSGSSRRREHLRLFGGKRIHNRRPSRINSFEDECSILYDTVHEKSLRHVRFVGLSGSRSMSFRAARIVAANRMANFLSSVIWNPRSLILLRVGKRGMQFTFPYPKCPCRV